ncbi:MAG: hypothetical protein K1V80_04205 [Muribaculaceae bacterium]
MPGYELTGFLRMPCWYAAPPIPHPLGCFFYPLGFPGMPSLRSCIPGYGVADILPDVIFPISLLWRTMDATRMSYSRYLCGGVRWMRRGCHVADFVQRNPEDYAPKNKNGGC